MWEYASFTFKVKITHTFLERGHTQSEGDSMHSCVEHAKKGKSIYVPVQWVTLVRCSKVKGNQFRVIEVSYDEFLDFKPLVEDKKFNFKTSTNGDIIKWNSVKQVFVSFESPFDLWKVSAS